jgi:hypothetical protein
MITRVQENNLVTGLISNLIPKGVEVLQYVDDMIICLEHDLEKARNMKLPPYMFEQLPGLKINFDKSVILMIWVGGGGGGLVIYAKMFNCNVNVFPLRYLGVPIAAGRLHVVDWSKLEDKSVKKLDVWKGGSLSMGGRSVLINTSYPTLLYTIYQCFLCLRQL